MKMFSILILIIASSLAQAFPRIKSSDFQLVQKSSTFTSGYNFEGIVALSNCSGSLIQLETGKDSDHALVLTNGHCLETGFPKPGQVIVNQASHRSFRLLKADAQQVGTVTATKVLYSTMTKTDMTLYQLKETYADIKTKYKINPLTLSSKEPQANDPIEVISGYWKKGYACHVQYIVHELKEGGWTCEDSLRYTEPGCETIGGTSGSPVVMQGTRTVIGVNNTGNEDGESCTENNPCEIDEHGKMTVEKGASYGQQTYWVYSCLDNNNNLDLQRAGCRLALP